jgi:hypothetical protein
LSAATQSPAAISLGATHQLLSLQRVAGNQAVTSLVQRAVDSPTVADDSDNIVDPRIDVRAQFALLRLFKGPPDEAAIARGLFADIKNGRMQGIFGDDLKASVDIARARQTVRWELVPSGQDAVRIDDGGPGAPVVVFRESAGSAPRLDTALLAVGNAAPITGGLPAPLPPGPLAGILGPLGRQPPRKPIITVSTPEICMTLGSTTLLGTSKGSALGVVAERFVSLDFL